MTKRKKERNGSKTVTGKEERKHKIKSKEGMVVIKSGKRDIMVQDYMVQKKRAR